MDMAKEGDAKVDIDQVRRASLEISSTDASSVDHKELEFDQSDKSSSNKENGDSINIGSMHPA